MLRVAVIGTVVRVCSISRNTLLSMVLILFGSFLYIPGVFMFSYAVKLKAVQLLSLYLKAFSREIKLINKVLSWVLTWRHPLG